MLIILSVVILFFRIASMLIALVSNMVFPLLLVVILLMPFIDLTGGLLEISIYEWG